MTPAFSWLDIIVIFKNEYLILQPFRSKREKEMRGLKEEHIKLWIFHRWKSSASDSASRDEASSSDFPRRALILFFPIFITASLKVERAKWLDDFAIIGALEKKMYKRARTPRVLNGTECQLQIGIYVSAKRQIIHGLRSLGSIAAHNSSLTLYCVLIPVAI